jgi:DNA-binding CsgD family transcriptional regulator
VSSSGRRAPAAPPCACSPARRPSRSRSWSRRIAAACCGWPGAREELNADGARPRRSALSGPGALTPAEHRVAELAARGHGNRAIAERLYVTPRTVETHLTHAFATLDIRSRAELAAALQPALADSGTLTAM